VQRPLLILFSLSACATPKPVEVPDDVAQLHATSILVDGHNDLPWLLRADANSSFDEHDIALRLDSGHTDIPRLREGGVGAQFWSIYVPAELEEKGGALAATLEQIDLVQRMVARYPETFAMAGTVADVERIRAEGKIACLLGVEGGYSIEDSLGALRALYELGVRYMTLTHANTISWADSATDEPQHGGLSDFGAEVCREMNRLGMLIDLSHVSDETMKDALRLSRAPVIFSHSSARAIADHPRNVPDDVLALVRENGGVVMVNFFSGFVVPESAQRMQAMFDVYRNLRERYPEEAAYDAAVAEWRAANPIERGTVADVADHIDHIVRVAGIDHVGLGSDYDGVSLLPRGLEDVSTYPNLTRELLGRGHSHEDVRKILGGNVLRALREAEQVAAQGRSDKR